MSSFSRGDYIQANLIAGNTHFVPAICFEIAFPKQVSANITDASNMIVTVSNDAWFGDSHGPHQHLQIAQVRAKEFGLPVMRATNNGVTAAIDHKGKIIGQIPQFKDVGLSISVDLVEGQTPYKKWGDAPIWLFALILLVVGLLHNKPN
jgi:apolipoprotein N-acyltransferase